LTPSFLGGGSITPNLLPALPGRCFSGRNENKLHYTEDDEDYDDEEEYECPQHTLPDGFGYCRKFDYEPLMQKSEEELANEIIQSLTEIREKMMKIREKMINSNSLPVIET
jgi:hypothetical protein